VDSHVSLALRLGVYTKPWFTRTIRSSVRINNVH